MGVIGVSDFKEGSRVKQMFGMEVAGMPPETIAKAALDVKLIKGIITHEEYFGARLELQDLIEKAEFSGKERKKLSKEDEAESDGSYPIRNESDLENAVKAFGRSKNPTKTKAWIKKRAKDLGCEDCLPDSWKDEKLEKGGEGSKGGKVIGHTKSGKAVYENKVGLDYDDKFAHQDHYDAAKIHSERSITPKDKHEKIAEGHISRGKQKQKLEAKIEKASDAIELVKQIDELIKGGEGSKGGEIIGHTRSGKAIYKSGKHSDYKNFHEYDHQEAGYHHSQISDMHRVKSNAHATLGRMAEEEKDKEGVKHYAGKKSESDNSEIHHAAQAQYHFEESRPNAVKDRASKIGQMVADIKKK